MDCTASDPIILSPAELADIPVLADTHIAAFKLDGGVQLLFATESQHREMVTVRTKDQIQDPEWAVMKATRGGSDEIIGWQACRFHNSDSDEERSSKSGAEAEDESTDTTPPPPLTLFTPLALPLREKCIAIRKTHMADKPYILLNTLVVPPRHQHRGIGSALVKWAITKADAEGLPCWLQSSMVARGLYEKAGFEEVEKLDMDLEEFGRGCGKDLGGGVYRMSFMRRLPR